MMRNVCSTFTTVAAALAAAFSLGSMACGGNSGSPDASPRADATPLPPDAMPAPNVTVRLLYAPQDYDRQASRVVFHLADGRLSGVATIDEDGVAHGYVNPGGAATVIRHRLAPSEMDFSNSVIRTITGVMPGDELNVGYAFTFQPAFAFTVNAPAFAGASAYRVIANCNRGTSGSPMNEASTGHSVQVNGCETADLLMLALGDSSETLGTLFNDDVPVASGATVELVGSYEALRERSYTFTGIPANVTSAALTVFPHHMNGVYTPNLVPVNGVLEHTATFSRTSLLEPTSAIQLQYADGASQRYRAPDDFVGDYTLALAPLLLTKINSVAWQGEGQAVMWTVGPDGAAATAVFAAFSYRHETLRQTGDWTVLAARTDDNTMRFPEMPDEVESLVAIEGAALTPPWVSFETVSGATYDVYRSDAFNSLSSSLYRPDVVVASSDFYPAD